MTIELNPSEHPHLGERNLTSDQVWIDLLHSSLRFERASPALFLDRDGVIVTDTHYLSDPDQVELLPGAAELIHTANISGIPVIVVTNQSGIGRGYFGWREFEQIQDRIEELLSQHDARWDAVFACPHHRDAIPPFRHDNHPCRKPNPGMLLAAQEILNVNLGLSWIVGDKAGDLEAGKHAGLTGGVYVSTHSVSAESEREKSLRLENDQFLVRAHDSVSGIWSLLRY